MTQYLDTSLVVAALTSEPKSADVLEWLDLQEPDQLFISDWVLTEVSAALSIKLRTGQITAVERGRTAAAFANLCATHLTILPVAGPHFRDAGRLAERHTLGLRAGDALHLAICATRGATLYTLDRRQSEAALALGVVSVLL